MEKLVALARELGVLDRLDLRPLDFDPRVYANRIPWQLGDTLGTAEVWISDRIAWQVERHFSAYGEMAGNVFRTNQNIRPASPDRSSSLERFAARAPGL